MTQYMLDTNTVSQLLRKDPILVERAKGVPISALCISSVTKGELFFGLARRPAATRLHKSVVEFLRCVDVLPWDEIVAERYAQTRAALERKGKTVAPLDLLIGTHAQSLGAILVTNDQAFRFIDGLSLKDWTKE
jgi:tRNA(fMet)-specific endonuclease VapC